MRIAIIMLVVLLASPVFASEPATAEEVSALRAEIAELRAAIAVLQVVQPEKRVFSIGVMPIENTWSIPQVGDAFRQVLISTLNEAGIRAVESLDEETLRWVQRQDQLVRERWIDPLTAPPRGELQGVTHFLLGTVTRYAEQDVEDVKVLAGFIRVSFSGSRVRIGSLVVDFRLVDARTGVVEDSFLTESLVRRKEGYVSGWYSYKYQRQEPLPERAARDCARQAAERIAGLFNPAPPAATTQPQPVKPAATKK